MATSTGFDDAGKDQARFVESINLKVTSVAATGSTTTDAALLSPLGILHVTAADGTKGVRIQGGTVTDRSNYSPLLIVKNSDAANAILKIYPPTGGKINAGSTDAALSMAAKTAALFVTFDGGTNWVSLPLLPS